MSPVVLLFALQAVSDQPAMPRNAVALDVGLFSAVGELGVTYLVRAIGPLEIELGVGAGFSGGQASFMPKLSFGSTPNHHATTGIGIATTFSPATATRGNPVWLNVDLFGYEYRSPGHFFFSMAAGFFHGLGGGGVCVVDCEGTNEYATDVTKQWGPQARVAIGATF